MKIITLYAAVSGYEQNLDFVINLANSTYKELGVEFEVINIAHLNIPYFNGKKSHLMEKVLNIINYADGLIFATTSQNFAPSAIMQTFLEHLNNDIYTNTIKNKNCFAITISNDNSEYQASTYINQLINSLGGYTISTMAIGKNYLKSIVTSNSIKDMIEKYLEDFYRMLRQNRSFFAYNFVNVNNSNDSTELFVDDIIFNSMNNKDISQLYENNINQSLLTTNKNNTFANNNNYSQSAIFDTKFSTSNFNSVKPKDFPSIDIKTTAFNDDIKNLDFENEKNYKKSDYNNMDFKNINDVESNINKQNNYINTNVNKQAKSIINSINNKNGSFNDKVDFSSTSCKQKTQSLYHFFQPQLAKDINCIIQVSISGEENFDGYFTIKDGDCIYNDGINQNPDVLIHSSTGVWSDILNGKYTIQKAFMIGKLKVKGNFILIGKFDQIFKFGK